MRCFFYINMNIYIFRENILSPMPKCTKNNENVEFMIQLVIQTSTALNLDLLIRRTVLNR